MTLVLSEIAANLLSGKHVLLIAHTQPDADALGSALAVGLALEERGVKVGVTFPDRPFGVPRGLRFLPRQDLLVNPAELPDADVVMALDASSADRIGDLLAVGQAAKIFMAIDHHASFDHFADINYVDPRQPATGMIAMQLLQRMDVVITPDIATCLYAAISSDTGSFRYPATTADTLRVAADLMDAGIDFAGIAKELFDTKTRPFLSLQAAVLGALDTQLLDDLTIVVGVVSRADRERHGVLFSDIEPLIDSVRVVEGADVAVVLKEDDRGFWRVSARSMGRVDVGRACLSLGGGGHRMAAGFTGSKSATETLNDLLAALASQ